MITRIELDGFKTFLDFTLDLAPFQVIIGANGVGKSNLFDALRLLSRLAQLPVSRAFTDRHGRGNSHELFSLLPNGERATQIRLAVELLIDTQHPDTKSDLEYTRFRYESAIERGVDEHGLGQC